MSAWTFTGPREACTFETLTPELARAFYGKDPARTMRGYAAVAGGQPIVLVGVMRDEHRWVLFSDSKPEARGRATFAARRLVLEGIARLRGLMESLHAPVHAAPQKDIAGACALLERLGFVHITQGVYQWQDRRSS